jgi:hypothetical protein
MFSWASWANRYSFPILRAGSPVHFSSGPSVAKSTFAAFRIRTRAWFVLRARGSVEPAHPTHSRYSTSRPPSSAITGTSRPSAHSRRRSWPTPHGLPCTSMPLNAAVASCGKSDSIITRPCRRPMRSPGTESMRTGQASTQAAQVVQAHSSSTWTCPSPISAFATRGVFGSKAASSSAFPGRGRPLESRNLRMSVPLRSRRFTFRSWSTFIGWRGFPVAWAGHAALQRPHSVQA